MPSITVCTARQIVQAKAVYFAAANPSLSFTMNKPNSPPSLMQVVQSVLAAFFGVQNSTNRERDFKHGKPHQFIIIGLLTTVTFIGLVFLIVKTMMYFAV